MKKIILLLIICTNSFSQDFTLQWINTFGTNQYDAPHSLITTSDGGYVIAGIMNQNPFLSSTLEVIKLDNSGGLVWQTSIPSSIGASVLQASDGGYLIGGTKITGSQKDFYIVKLDSAGQISWEVTYSGGTNAQLNSIAQAPDGGYLLAGTLFNNFFIVRVTASGNLLWQKSLGSGYLDIATSIICLADKIIVAGRAGCGGDVGCHFSYDDRGWIVCLDYNNNILWQEDYSNGVGNWIEDIKVAPDGGFICTGYTNGNLWLLKVNSTGVYQWAKTFDGSGYERGYSINVTSDGNYLVGGGSQVYSNPIGAVMGQANGTGRAWLAKLDLYGNIMWHKRIGGTIHDNIRYEEIRDVKEIAPGEYIICGNTSSNTGDIPVNYGWFDWFVCKLSVTLDTDDVVQQDIQIYPNPVENKIFIKLPDNTAAEKILISTADGKIVISVPKAKELDVSGLTAGIYFVSFQVLDKRYVKKIIKS